MSLLDIDLDNVLLCHLFVLFAPVNVQANYASRLARAGPVEESLVDSFHAALSSRTAAAYTTSAYTEDAVADLTLATPLADATTAEPKAALAAAEEESDVTPDGSPNRLDGRVGDWQQSLSEVSLRSWPTTNSKTRIASSFSTRR